MRILCSFSALDIWSDGTNRQDISDRIVRNYRPLPCPPDIPCSNNDARSLFENYNLAQPIHLMVTRKSYRRHSEFIQHNIADTIPRDSFVHIFGDFYLACPELCLLQAANKCSIHELVFLINQLCGTYYVDRNSPYKQQNRLPVTSIAEIKSYLDSASGTGGVSRLTRALKYAVDGCNSIVEASVATIVSLPYSLGGFGFPLPRMNAVITLSRRGSLLLGRESCRPDFSWVKPKKVALEYDSNLSHLSISQHAEDKKRVNAMEASGYAVRTLIARDLSSQKNIDVFFRDLRQTLGLHNRDSFLDKYSDVRHGVIRDLFNHQFFGQ